MDHRARFFSSLSRQAPDRVPIDLGATTLTSMSAGCQEALSRELGLQGPAKPSNSGVDERILEWAGTDFRAVGNIVELPSPHSRRISDTELINCWGMRSRFIHGYWQFFDPPLKGASRADLKAYRWPLPRVDEYLLAAWETKAKQLHHEGKYVVVAEHPVLGILELGCWMCGYEDFLVHIAEDDDFVREFFEIVFGIQTAVIEQYYPVLGPYIDITTSGDDFGTQQGPLVSPKQFDTLIKPWFQARIARTKELGMCLYWHHSCGSVMRLLDLIVECGVDILNPIQTSAVGMVPADLKAGFGDRLMFWGAMDVQQFLRTATPDEVRQRVRDLVGVLGRSGGYVLAPGHNIQDDVPARNIVAWIEEARLGEEPATP